MAIAVSVLIIWTAWGLMRDALRLELELEGVPENIDRQAVADWVGAQPGVTNVHDLRIWALSTTRTALAVHTVWQGDDADAVPDHVTYELEHDFGILHSTVQVEREPCSASCLLTVA